MGIWNSLMFRSEGSNDLTTSAKMELWQTRAFKAEPLTTVVVWDHIAKAQVLEISQ